jgi:hypothetical protein
MPTSKNICDIQVTGLDVFRLFTNSSFTHTLSCRETITYWYLFKIWSDEWDFKLFQSCNWIIHFLSIFSQSLLLIISLLSTLEKIHTCFNKLSIIERLQNGIDLDSIRRKIYILQRGIPANPIAYFIILAIWTAMQSQNWIFCEVIQTVKACLRIRQAYYVGKVKATYSETPNTGP